MYTHPLPNPIPPGPADGPPLRPICGRPGRYGVGAPFPPRSTMFRFAAFIVLLPL